jgi:hypothetical protein
LLPGGCNQAIFVGFFDRRFPLKLDWIGFGVHVAEILTRNPKCDVCLRKVCFASTKRMFYRVQPTNDAGKPELLPNLRSGQSSQQLTCELNAHQLRSSHWRNSFRKASGL